MVQVESGGNANAVSPAGAKGWLQFMPDTAKRFNILGKEHDLGAAGEAAAQYIEYLLDYFDGDLELALAAYNAGEGRVANALKGQGKPLAQETLDYPGKVLAAMGVSGRGVSGNRRAVPGRAPQNAPQKTTVELDDLLLGAR
jgi:soluble lytic murein transglycosylase-like protein